MLNKIWFGLLLIGLLYGFGRAAFVDPAKVVPAPEGTASGAEETASSQPAPTRREAMTFMGKALTDAAFDGAKTSVELCIGLIGIMALWLGLMKIAEDSGLVQALAWLLRPMMRMLFPEVPKGHPAAGAMIMNLAANMLGLDNAATPLGLKAMKELQTLNPEPDTATNSMAMFLAINTSSITLVPFTIIGWRVTAGSTDAAAPVVAMTLATACSTLVAILACRGLQPFYGSSRARGPRAEDTP